MNFGKKVQQLFSVVLALVMVVSLMPVGLLPVAAATTEFAGGSGIESDPYLISNKTQFNNVRNHLDAYFKLTKDIIFSAADFQEGGAFYNDGMGFEPIGTVNSPFTGVFGGNGFAIKNVTVKVESTGKAYVGIFGYNKGRITDLGKYGGQISATGSSVYMGGIVGHNEGTVDNCYNVGKLEISFNANSYSYVGGIAGTNKGTIKGSYNTGLIKARDAVGGIAGENDYGIIINCYNTGTVSGNYGSNYRDGGESGGITGGEGTVTDCYNTGTVSGTEAGGIAGFQSDIIRCYNSGRVTGIGLEPQYAGGILGYLGSVTDCYNTGAISAEQAGGIVGKGARDIINCYNIGTVKSTFSNEYYAGGIVGTGNGWTENCYYYDIISKGLGNGLGSVGLTKCTLEQLQQQSTFAGFDFENVWIMSDDAEYPHPVLRGFDQNQHATDGGFSKGNGTESDPYLISNKIQLGKVCNHLDAHFKLVSDIVFTDADYQEGGAFYNDGMGFEPIGTKEAPFTGVFDGNGYSVYNLYINVETSSFNAYVGFFGYNEGTIKNLSIIGGEVSATASLPFVGSLTGYNYGTIDNCFNSADISASGTRYFEVGGIAGRSHGTISNCRNTGSVFAFYEAVIGGIVGTNFDGIVEKCYNTGMVYSGAFITTGGGIAGHSLGKITDCYNVGDVLAWNYAGGIAGSHSGTIENCYSVGCVSTNDLNIPEICAGGITGESYHAEEPMTIITNCYYLDSVAQGVGYGPHTATKCTIEEMKQQTVFAGFDFENVWDFDETLETHPFPVLKGLAHVEKEDNTTDFAGGKGTCFSPYLVSDKMQLDNVRNYPGAHFKLISDIVFTDADFQEGGAFYNGGTGFEPIGTGYDFSFFGTFDGDGHIIKNIYINVKANETVYGAVFARNEGTIKNLGVVDGSVEAEPFGGENPFVYAGGIAGHNMGRIENCYNTAAITAYSIPGFSHAGGISGWNSGRTNNCYNAGSIQSDDYSGGITGDNTGRINGCRNAGSVSSRDYAGGIAGQNYGTIEKCYNVADVSLVVSQLYGVGGGVGGIVGHINEGMIADCYNAGEISIYEGSSYSVAGGIAGRSYTGTIKNCYNIGAVFRRDSGLYISGIIARTDHFDFVTVTDYCYYVDTVSKGVCSPTDTTVKCTFEQMQQQTTFVGFDFESVWMMSDDMDYPYPVLRGNDMVEARIATSISVTTLPDKLTYVEGEELDLTGTVVTAHYNNNTFEVVTDYTVSGYDSTVGSQTITVTYKGLAATFTVAVNPKAPSSLDSEIYTISESYVDRVKTATTASELLSNLEGGAYCKVYKGENEVAGDTLIGTGMTVNVMQGDEVIDSYTVVVSGDLNGNGKLDSIDYALLKRMFIGGYDFSDTIKKAGDTNGNGKLQATDYALLKRAFLGIYVIP